VAQYLLGCTSTGLTLLKGEGVVMESKPSVWELGGLSWKNLSKRVWDQIQEDDVFGRSAQLSYYFLLALFPLLIFLTSLLGYFTGENSSLREGLFNYLGQVIPGSAANLVNTTIHQVTEGSGGGKLSFGILATLWAASNGMGAIISSLNVTYEVEESRPWWKARLIAIGLTIGLAVLIISALVLVLQGGNIGNLIASNFGLGNVFTTTWSILQWPIILGFMLLSFALIYYFAPDVKEQKWHWVSPGAMIGVALWLIASFAFRTYLSYFDSYNATYGSLGAVIVLMLWFYMTGMAILVGGEVNSEIENAAAEHGNPEAKESGEKRSDDSKPTEGRSSSEPHTKVKAVNATSSSTSHIVSQTDQDRLKRMGIK
jgi:membrane protein